MFDYFSSKFIVTNAIAFIETYEHERWNRGFSMPDSLFSSAEHPDSGKSLGNDKSSPKSGPRCQVRLASRSPSSLPLLASPRRQPHRQYGSGNQPRIAEHDLDHLPDRLNGVLVSAVTFL